MSAASVVPPAGRRIGRITIWLVGLALFWFLLQVLGVSVRDWLESLWDQIKAIREHNPGYIVGALSFETGQTFFAGVAYFGILKAAYKDEVKLWQIIAAYSVGVAMNGFLPANIGTFVTLVMYVAIIPSRPKPPSRSTAASSMPETATASREAPTTPPSTRDRRCTHAVRSDY